MARATRRGLVKDRVAASIRNHTHRSPLLKRLAEQRLRQVERQLAAIDAALRALCQADLDLKARLDILVSIPAIDEAPALAMLNAMPELGTLETIVSPASPPSPATQDSTAASASFPPDALTFAKPSTCEP